ncbi:hypothetical protein KM043_006324 [Ampulex compressa]|nr:hypothetical protein KM043_006324 [Ampulex compressa]
MAKAKEKNSRSIPIPRSEAGAREGRRNESSTLAKRGRSWKPEEESSVYPRKQTRTLVARRGRLKTSHPARRIPAYPTHPPSKRGISRRPSCSAWSARSPWSAVSGGGLGSFEVSGRRDKGRDSPVAASYGFGREGGGRRGLATAPLPLTAGARMLV